MEMASTAQLQDHSLNEKDRKIAEQNEIIQKLENVIDLNKSKSRTESSSLKLEIKELQGRIKNLKQEVREGDSICTANSQLQTNTRIL